MKKIFLAFVIILSMVGYSYAACVDNGGGSWTASVDLASVQSCVTQAARGDTVNISAGSATWNSVLTIDKAITLKGAGSGSTIITSGHDHTSLSSRSSAYYMIYYNPSSIASDTNETLRITGFTFDMDNRSSGIYIRNISNTPLNKLVIDNNILDHCWDGNDSTWTAVSCILTYGAVYGVIHSNTIKGWPHIETMGRDANAYTSTANNYTHGTANALYFEDNLIWSPATSTSYPTQHTDASWWIDLDAGAWAVWRYNTFRTDRTYSSHGMTYIPHHGSSVNYASKGGEFYGNYINHTPGTATNVRLFGIRGGKSLIYFNKINAVTAIGEYLYYSTATADTDNVCGSGTLRSGLEYCAEDGQPQDVWRSAWWNNRYGTSGNNTLINGSQGYGGGTLRANIDYFKPNSNCTSSACSSGVGCGAAAPTGSCTTGVMYWKTDDSCTSIEDGKYGQNPTTPLSGTLYRCNSTNNWGIYYIPYTYPHPYREDVPEDTTAPAISNRVPAQGAEQACTVESPYNTQSINVGFVVNDQTQGSVVCYVDTTSRANYAALAAAGTLMTLDGTAASATIANQTCGLQTTVYYACTDGTNDNDVASWTFPIATGNDTTAPTVTNVTQASQSCCGILLRVSTDEPSTCRYCQYDGDACTSATTWANRTPFSVTGGDTVHHSTSVSQAESTAQKYEVLCQDTQENESSNLELTVTTDASKTVSGIDIGSGNLTINIGTGSLTINIITSP